VKVSGIIENAERAAWGFRLFSERSANRVEKAIFAGTLLLEGYIKANMSHPSPSEPGMPPAVVTGNLRARITSRTFRSFGVFIGECASLAAYSRDLEKGHGRVKPRPFMGQGLTMNKAKIVNMIRAAMKTAAKEAKA
jgi:hypothetical protein